MCSVFAQEAQYAAGESRTSNPNLPCASGETPPAWHGQRRLPNQGAVQSEPELCPICLRHAVDCILRTTQAGECATCGWLWDSPQLSFIIDPRLQLFGNERRAPNWSPQHHDTPGLTSFFAKAAHVLRWDSAFVPDFCLAVVKPNACDLEQVCGQSIVDVFHTAGC